MASINIPIKVNFIEAIPDGADDVIVHDIRTDDNGDLIMDVSAIKSGDTEVDKDVNVAK